MRWANHKLIRKLPSPLIKDAKCPCCDETVIPKCGQIKRWHWAHQKGNDCDDWSNAETKWHIDWKNQFPDDWQEVVMDKSPRLDSSGQQRIGWYRGQKHRADVQTPKGMIVEFQNSRISPEDIIKREEFYGFVKWVLNGSSFAQNLELRPKGDYYSFRWKWPPQIWFSAKCPLYVDMQPLVDEMIVELSELPEGDFINEYNRVDRYGHPIDVVRINLKFKRERLQEDILLYSDKLFLIKKVYKTTPCGGWGKLISKQHFIQGVKDEFRGD